MLEILDFVNLPEILIKCASNENFVRFYCSALAFVRYQQ